MRAAGAVSDRAYKPGGRRRLGAAALSPRSTARQRRATFRRPVERGEPVDGERLRGRPDVLDFSNNAWMMGLRYGHTGRGELQPAGRQRRPRPPRDLRRMDQEAPEQSGAFNSGERMMAGSFGSRSFWVLDPCRRCGRSVSPGASASIGPSVVTHGIIGGVMAHEVWSRGSAAIVRRLGNPGPVGEEASQALTSRMQRPEKKTERG